MKSVLEDSNSLIVVILTHGLEGDMLLAADTTFHLYDLMKMFTPEELPEMATRPKIFIIQACRGEQIDSGSLIKRQSVQFDSVDAFTPEIVIKYPSFADICIALSSHHGHYSYRNEDGSWFIQELCNAISENDLKTNHFLDILTDTNRRVTVRSSKSMDVRFDDKKQVSSFYTTLTQKFYFSK